MFSVGCFTEEKDKIGDRKQEIESTVPEQEVGKNHRNCEEGSENRGKEEEEGTQEIDNTRDMDGLSTECESEGTDEFQDCDGKESEDWTSEIAEADCGHQMMRNFSSHCIGRRTEIEQREQSGRVREEQEELEESVVHRHYEIEDRADEDDRSTCDHDQHWCAQALSCQTASCEYYCGLDLCRCPSGLVTLPSSLCFSQEYVASLSKQHESAFTVTCDIVSNCSYEVASIVSHFTETSSLHWPRSEASVIESCSFFKICSEFISFHRPLRFIMIIFISHPLC